MKFSLMFFASSEDALAGDKYRVVRESARFADSHGFSSVWVPERHFTQFGSLYPNPAVLHAALAMVTDRVRLLAGSVVGPLHNPMRIAEEWSMVDNLSNGRIGISFAPGWNPADFAFCPDKYESRREEMLAAVRDVQHLWQGSTVDAIDGIGDSVKLRIYPTPVQQELPLWLTAAGNPSTFARAGEIGANLLTHLLDQDEEQLARKIALYRQARSDSGHDPSAGIVTAMLHTFVGADAETVREQARGPFCQYIKTNAGLLSGLARSRGRVVDFATMSERELNEFVEFLYDRFAGSRGLIGTPETCLDLVARLEEMGVDEIACLLDFGPPADLILENLTHLLRLKTAYGAATATPRERGVSFEPAAVQRRCTDCISGAEFNDTLRRRGIRIEGEFSGIERIWRRSGEALGEIRVTKSTGNYGIRPAFLDSCGRVLAAAIDEEDLQNDYYLPSGVESLRLHGPAEACAWSHATLRKAASPDTLVGDVRVYSAAPQGTVARLLIEIEGLSFQRIRSERPDLDPLFYKIVWKKSPTHRRRETPLPREWLIFADRRGVGERMGRMLEEAGGACSLIYADAQEPEIVAQAWQGIIHCWSLDLSPGDAESYKRVVASILRIVQADASTGLWLVTSGAMPVLEGEAPSVAQSPVWGLGRAIAVEHAQLWRGLIDLDIDLDNHASAVDLRNAIEAGDREDMVAFRNGERYAARLVRGQFCDAAPLRFDDDSTFLITGGLGGLGLRLASWLADKGVRNLALIGRNPPSQRALEVVNRLGAMKTNVQVFRADVSRCDDLADAIAEIRRLMPPVKGIFHLAGVLDDALLTGQDADRFARAGAAKMQGAWHLHELLSETPLDYFVLFSSISSLVALPGQGNYAAANAFLDALAHLRRALGKPALSINWGPWAEIGHAATAYGRAAHARLGEFGIGSLRPERGIAALEELIGRGEICAGVAQVNWRRLFDADPAAAQSPLLSELAPAQAPVAQRDSDLVTRIKECTPQERRDFLTAFLSRIITEVLRLQDPEILAPDRSLFDLGLDSILALELTNRISLALGRPLRATLFFTHPTLESLADYLLGELAPVAAEEPKPEALTEEELAELIVEEIGQR